MSWSVSASGPQPQVDAELTRQIQGHQPLASATETAIRDHICQALVRVVRENPAEASLSVSASGSETRYHDGVATHGFTVGVSANYQPKPQEAPPEQAA